MVKQSSSLFTRHDVEQILPVFNKANDLPATTGNSKPLALSL